ncbi:uncharacterized protein LOC100837412 isoform X2 [Brachypodium distachyon]|uniref:uncharacterized protein LOC100837412 isoform X2 n=1 Tax=Brachypodium distachyon TaxID=15368 RepID=UPI0005300505|nr:uncharacterized protein LOC100837412 isoform X2 [Brachypodium distachyon]|eukprot:XP_003575885.2 uncharacterized protein LOC100837412 isoform X2 [Brachypodium distachyon]
MEKIMEEGKQKQQQERRSSVPAFGEWEETMKAAGGALPDYSLDFTKIRAARMQRKDAPLSATWPAVHELSASGDRRSVGSDTDAGRHRRQHSDGTDLRRPLRPDRAAPKGRSKSKGCLFGCMGGW